MKKFFLVSFIVLLAFASSAQNFDKLFSPDTSRINFDISGSYFVNSSAFTNQFYKTVYTGNYISDEIKSNVFKRSGRKNNFGTDARYGIKLGYAPDSLFKRKFGGKIFLSYSQNLQLNSSFSGDLLSLILDGNSKFKGKEINGSGFSVNFINFRKYSAGLTNINSNNWTMSASLSYYEGISFLRLKAEALNIYTSDNYNDIDISAHYSVERSDTNKFKAKYPKGSGAGIDFSAMKSLDKKWLKNFGFSIENLGAISWNENTLSCTKDTNLTYSGVDLNYLIENVDTTNNKLSLANLKADFFNVKKERMITILPFELNAFLNITLSKKLTLTESVYWRYASNFKPCWLNQLNYAITSNYYAGVGLAYGGYGKLNSNLSFACRPIKVIALSVYFTGVEHFVLPEKTSAQGLFIKLQYLIK